MTDTAPRIAFIGFGEAGSLISEGLAGEGLTGMAAIDPALADSSRAWLVQKALANGVTLLRDPAELAGFDVVLVLVQPTAAVAVARAYAPHLGPQTVYVDMTSCGPVQKAEAGGVILAAGHRFVDAAMLGSVPMSRHRIPTVVAGPDAAAFVARMAPFGMAIRVIPGEIGSAAGVKIVRSILAKGIEALFAESLVIARRYGIEDEVLGSFAEFMDQHPMAEHAKRMLRAHVVHAARRADEVRMSVQTARDVGVEPLITQAIVDVLDRTTDSGIAARYGGKQPDSFAEALAGLDEAWGGGRAGS